MKYKSVIFISIILFVACGSSKPRYATEEELRQYTGPYYVIFTFFPENSHSMSMGGIGDIFDIESLRKNNLSDFVESFYQQLVYFPFFINDFNYREIANCLGYNITWDIKYPNTPIFSDLIEIKKFKLQDGIYVNIKTYRVLGELDVKYVEDYEECIVPSSIELDINKIKSIDKVAVLLDKED